VVTPDPSEREKWEADIRLRERELALKEREQENRQHEATVQALEFKRSRWSNPLVLAVLAAALAATGNAVVALINGAAQRASDERHAVVEDKLQTEKASEERQLEESKAEATRILEMIRTADSDRAKVNLRFLLEAGLIVDTGRREKLSQYLETHEQGPALPSAITSFPLSSGKVSFGTLGPVTFQCVLDDKQNVSGFIDALLFDIQKSPEGGLLSIGKASTGIQLFSKFGGSRLGEISISGADNHVLVTSDLSGVFMDRVREVALKSIHSHSRQCDPAS
jgi:hypothetical protein